MRSLGFGIAVAAATLVSALVFVVVMGTIVFDAKTLYTSAGGYGLAIFLSFPLLMGFLAWRNQR